MKKTIIVAFAILAATSLANASIIYAPNNLPRPYPFSGSDELVMFDSSSPADFVVVGSMNVPNISFGGMDFDADGNLWAYASLYKNTGGAASGLYSVNVDTGAATRIGSSTQPLDDLAFNPVEDTMYGIRQQGADTRLFQVNLTTGATSLVGSFTGLSSTPGAIGLAIDSQGNFYVHDNREDKIYKGSGLAMTELYSLTQDTAYSQGMSIDWSRDDLGYHGAVGQGEYPDYFSQINTFASDGSSYVLGPDFGPVEHFPGDVFGYPLVEPGDIAILPVPEPSSFLLLSVLMLLRRR